MKILSDIQPKFDLLSIKILRPIAFKTNFYKNSLQTSYNIFSWSLSLLQNNTNIIWKELYLLFKQTVFETEKLVKKLTSKRENNQKIYKNTIKISFIIFTKKN